MPTGHWLSLIAPERRAGHAGRTGRLAGSASRGCTAVCALRDERPRPRRAFVFVDSTPRDKPRCSRRHVHEQAARRPDRVRLGHTARLPGRPVRRVPALALRRLPDQRPRFGRRARRPYRRPQLRADAAAGVDGDAGPHSRPRRARPSCSCTSSTSFGSAGTGRASSRRPVAPTSIATRRPTLDDVYLRLTGGQLPAAA